MNNCCIPKGRCSLKVFFEKDSYVQGESAKVMIYVDNGECKLSIKNVTFSLN